MTGLTHTPCIVSWLMHLSVWFGLVWILLKTCSHSITVTVYSVSAIVSKYINISEECWQCVCTRAAIHWERGSSPILAFKNRVRTLPTFRPDTLVIFRAKEDQSIRSKRRQGSNPVFLKLVSENYLFLITKPTEKPSQQSIGHAYCVRFAVAVYQLVHGSRRGFTRWVGATKCTLECYAELLLGLSEIGSRACFNCWCLWVHLCTLYRVHKRCTQETVYSLGWEDMGAVVKLNKWIKNRWGSV